MNHNFNKPKLGDKQILVLYHRILHKNHDANTQHDISNKKKRYSYTLDVFIYFRPY